MATSGRKPWIWALLLLAMIWTVWFIRIPSQVQVRDLSLLSAVVAVLPKTARQKGTNVMCGIVHS